MDSINQENIMYKKFISSILVIALLNLLGCYSSELINVTEYNQIEERGKPREILVKTYGSLKYHFLKKGHYIENDTLYGKVSVKELPFEGKFAFGEIKSIQILPFGYAVSHYQKIEAESGKPDEIYLKKNDFTKYHFMKNDYYIENDTLYGKGKLILDEEELLDRNIALSHIESIQFEYVDGIATTFLVLSTVLIIVLIGLAVSLQDFRLINFGDKN